MQLPQMHPAVFVQGLKPATAYEYLVFRRDSAGQIVNFTESPFGTSTLDADAGTRIVIECDGWTTHGLDRDQFEFDRIRNVDLTAAGYVMVHITWRRLTTQPAKVAEQLWMVLREWAPELVAGATG